MGAKIKLPGVSEKDAAFDGITDCHLHVYDGRFPTDRSAAIPAPTNSTATDYLDIRKRLGMSRAVVVQPSTYGADNRCLIDALTVFGETGRGVATITEAVSDADLSRLHASGVRGMRFDVVRSANLTPSGLYGLAARIADFGWHVEVHAMGTAYPDLVPMLQRLPVLKVLDHMGRLPQPEGLKHSAWTALRRLVDGGDTWVKLSGAYHDSHAGPPEYADASDVALAWLKVAPERMVWGTDWPFPSALAGEKALPDVSVLYRLMESWMPDGALRHRVLVENPAALYGFPIASSDADRST